MVLAYVACSLDGFIAGENGELDWLENLDRPQIDYFDFPALMEHIDCVLMGANTCRKLASLNQWPYRKRVFVYSSTIRSLPLAIADNAELIGGDPSDVLESLRGKGYERICVDGGKTIQAFLMNDLLDEIYICYISKILGGGIPLFGNLGKKIEMETLEVGSLTRQMTMCRYRVLKKTF